MNNIKNVLICGLGAIGGYYASVISNNSRFNLKVLIDGNRLEKYKKYPRIINDKIYNFDYILPSDTTYSADLIIIATKSSGLNAAIKNIENFVNDNTVILSFMNGISSEVELEKHYGEDKVLYSYLLGHTFFRKDCVITHDGNAKIIFGSKYKDDKKVDTVKEFFDEIGVQSEISHNIITSLWNKFCFNCCANQLSAITGQTFGELRTNEKSLSIMKCIANEVSLIAEREGIQGYDEFWENTKRSLDLMIPEGKTSMLQDVEAGVKPETDIFGKTVVEYGKKHGVEIVYNKIISDLIDLRPYTNLPCASFAYQSK